ncbi:DUF4136 domain-containing protein [Sphingomonas sp. G-3-2-10]|jgi:hypothetical protein|uniref:DUF4136 domain-containing protein n=1 Tax=Sphingomonas sp. G-3-2-10 TaxID=2728838 RepID=UPI00146AF32F|nr:DUF4136 domain-containing protein [Sphingomonas sp. G-3-2-10]NML07025.1 DUF4136 domain-containing protein [Sphingomonas sp. G-3-2-10]
MGRIKALATIGAAVALSGCMAGPRTGPIDVTRYHLGNPVAADTIAVEPLTGFAGVSPEDQVYAAAIRAELSRIGFAASPGGPSAYVAAFSYTRTSRGFVRRQSPVSIGIGGGGFSGGRRGGVGIGGGVSVPVGSGRSDEVIATELRVQLKRRSDNSIVWEGRAVTETVGNGPTTQPAATADRLAKALFKGFPGESGITITVK